MKAHRKARIKSISAERLRTALDSGHIVIVAGFQGSTIDGGKSPRLGAPAAPIRRRVALAAALKADQKAAISIPMSMGVHDPTHAS